MRLEEFNSMQRNILFSLKTAGGKGRSRENFVKEFHMTGAFEDELLGYYDPAMLGFEREGFIIQDGERYVLTVKGWKVAEELQLIGPKYDLEDMRKCKSVGEIAEKFGRRNS